MEIRVDGRPLAVLMRTPGRDQELAAGFLYTEAFIEHGEDIAAIRPCKDGENILKVALLPGAGAAIRKRLDTEVRHIVAGSSCGVCGKASIDSVRLQAEPLLDRIQPDPQLLSLLPPRMRAHQKLFDATGGIHAAALFDEQGQLLRIAEDIGRHNAVDKLVGSWVLKGHLPPDRCILLVSGRLSFEIVQKAWMAGFSLVVAVGAASSLAVDLASEAGMSLAWFVGPDRWNLFEPSTQ